MNGPIVLFGEYLLRLTPPAQQKLVQAHHLEMHWAGSEANIGLSLARLGANATYVTCLPQTALAEAGMGFLKSWGLHTRVHWKEGRVGLYFYESPAGIRNGQIWYDRAHSSFSFLQPGEIDWNDVLKDASWFHWSGITPALNAQCAAVCEEALQAAKARGIRVSADLNYRSTLWKWGKAPKEVMPDLLQYCDVLLADVDAAKLYFDINPDTKDLVQSTCMLLKEKLPHVEQLAMTMRYQNSAIDFSYVGYLWNEGKLHTSKAFAVNDIIERIGAGDAFMAGLIDGLMQKKQSQEVIDFATACGAIKHTISGDVNLSSRAEIETVMQSAGHAKIIR